MLIQRMAGTGQHSKHTGTLAILEYYQTGSAVARG
jgi:hypothetical protein